MRKLDIMPPIEAPPARRSWGLLRFAVSFVIWTAFLLLAISLFTGF